MRNKLEAYPSIRRFKTGEFDSRRTDANTVLGLGLREIALGALFYLVALGAAIGG